MRSSQMIFIFFLVSIFWGSWDTSNWATAGPQSIPCSLFLWWLFLISSVSESCYFYSEEEGRWVVPSKRKEIK
jgi:hypothetical protein